MSVIAIYGAGPALGMSVARRFGRDGYRVALVARDQDRLDRMAGELAADGLDAAGFEADLTDQSAAMRATDEVEARFGPIDVVEYSPTPGGLFSGPAELDIAAVSRLLSLYVLTPIALAGRLLPGMLDRGQGGLLFSMGAAAKYPMPRIAGAGIALSALRSYIHALSQALAETGVYAGSLLIGATIENSAFHRRTDVRRIGDGPEVLVSPADLADRLWDMYAKRDRIEDEIAGTP